MTSRTQPFFAELDKLCQGLLNGGYVHNSVRVAVKCKSDTDVAFTFGANHNLTTKGTAGNLEARYKLTERNLTVAEKWNTSNLLGSEVMLEDFYTKNTKLILEISMQPEKKLLPQPDTSSGSNQANSQPTLVINKSFKARADYKNESGSGNVEAEFSSKGGPYLKCGASFGQDNFTTGFGLGYDVSSGTYTERLIGCQLRPNANDDLLFCLSYCMNSSSLITSGYTKQGDIEGGYLLQWSFSKSALSLGLGGRYRLNDELTLRAKIDNKAGLGFGFTRTLKKGFSITLSAMMNVLAPCSGALGGSFEISL